jgi:Asp-tRNA(Asn)/Glu-tRNA(Gln) amidotransferase A subunit family amidase
VRTISGLFSLCFRIATFKSAIVRASVPTVFVVTCLSGCAIPKARPESSTRDKAFIEYWPPSNDSRKLRLAVKDLIDMKGVVTTAGSEFLAKHAPPAKRDAKCLAIARQSGVQFVGKTNLSELAVAVSGMNAYYGTPRNPLDRGRIPGGSSSGSAVAVANDEADVAFGTDTAGSTRVPAACCGVVGLKTTFGLVPLEGVYPIAPNQLDTIGPLAKDIAGTVRGMDLLQAGFSGRYRQAVAAKPSADRIRIGRVYIKGTNPNVDRAVDEALAATGFTVVNLSSEFTEKWIQAQKDAATVAAVGAWLYDRKFQNESQVTIRTKAVIALGGLQYKTAYPEALRKQAAWKSELQRAFEHVDFIALPTLKNVPPHIPFFGGTVAFEAGALALQNTQAVNFGGVPALAIPIPIAHGSFPLTSLQLVAPRFAEADLLNAGRLVEAAVRNR